MLLLSQLDKYYCEVNTVFLILLVKSQFRQFPYLAIEFQLFVHSYYVTALEGRYKIAISQNRNHELSRLLKHSLIARAVLCLLPKDNCLLLSALIEAAMRTEASVFLVYFLAADSLGSSLQAYLTITIKVTFQRDSICSPSVP